MSSYRFVHAADLHLDTPFEGIGRIAPEIAEELRDASLNAWDALVRLCIEQQAQFLLIAGDIYDGEVRGVRAQMRFLRGLERLSACAVQVFVAHGNHDPAGGRWSAIREWPPGVTVFGHERVESALVQRDGNPLAVIHGISHATREVSDNLAHGFHRGGESCPHLAVLHCNVDRNPDHPLYCPCTLDDLCRARMDYWALGHIHSYRVVSSGESSAVYSGCLQGRSLKPSEQGAKGAVVAAIEHGRVVNPQFVPVGQVRFVELAFDVAGIADLGGLVTRLEQGVAAEQHRDPASGLVVRARLTGRGPVHGDLSAGAGATDELVKTLREEAVSRRPFVWWADVRNETRVDLNREAIRLRGDFSAELLRLRDEILEDEVRRARFIERQTADLSTPAFQRWSRDVTRDEVALLEEAETLALESLEARSSE